MVSPDLLCVTEIMMAWLQYSGDFFLVSNEYYILCGIVEREHFEYSHGNLSDPTSSLPHVCILEVQTPHYCMLRYTQYFSFLSNLTMLCI